MTTPEDRGEALIQSIFTPEELDEIFANAFNPYRLELAEVGVEDMLDYFDDLLAQLVATDDKDHKTTLIEKFLTNLATVIDIQMSRPIAIKEVSSFAYQEAGEGNVWAVLEKPAEVKGTFSGLVVMPWYDIPTEEPDDPEPYKRDYGLAIVLTDPTITHEDGITEPIGETTFVPLNHGRPELYHVLAADNS